MGEIIIDKVINNNIISAFVGDGSCCDGQRDWFQEETRTDCTE